MNIKRALLSYLKWVIPFVLAVMVLNIVLRLIDGPASAFDDGWLVFAVATTALVTWSYIQMWRDGRFRSR